MNKIISFIILILIQPWNNVNAQETLYNDRKITEEFHSPTFKAALYQMKIISDTSRIMYSEIRDVKKLQLIVTYPPKEDRKTFISIYSIIQHISRKLDIRRGERKLSLTL